MQVSREALDEALERLSGTSLRGLGATPKELSDAVLQNLIIEVLVPESLLLLSVLPDHAHDLTQTVGVINGHLDAPKRLHFPQQQIDMVPHLLFFCAFKSHNPLLFGFQLFVFHKGWLFHEKHVVDNLGGFLRLLEMVVSDDALRVLLSDTLHL